MLKLFSQQTQKLVPVQTDIKQQCETVTGGPLKNQFLAYFQFGEIVSRYLFPTMKKNIVKSQFMGHQQIFLFKSNKSLGLIITLLEKMRSQQEQNEVSIKVEDQIEEQSPRKSSGYVPGANSGKWSQEEHMKYIVFIDFNKEKMRSRENRRSNRFYEEMASFIATRNSLQCRSHHQKLEEKYCHVNKIIAFYKPFFSKTAYKQHMEDLINLKDKPQDPVTRYTLNEKHMIDVEVQTDIMDLNCEFRLVNPNLVVIQKKPAISQHPMVKIQAPMFYPPPYYHQIQVSPHSSASAHFPLPPMGWWTGYPSNSF